MRKLAAFLVAAFLLFPQRRSALLCGLCQMLRSLLGKAV